MINWNQFSIAARNCVKELTWEDDELLSILRTTEQPSRSIDAVGRPQVGAALVNQHPDPENYRRVMEIRRDIAVENSDEDYILYANLILCFLAKQSPFSENNQLFIIDIMTKQGEYEFLYVPHSQAICGQVVSQLTGR